MEDEDSKARRNLIVVSTLIVLAWWLQAPLDKISEKLLGMSSVGPEFEWRAWFAAFLGLVYFALRFRFSQSHVFAIDDLKKEFEKTQKFLLFKWIQRQVNLYVRQKTVPTILNPNFPERIEANRLLYNHTPLPIVGIHITELVLGSRDSTGQVITPEKGTVKGSVRMVITKNNSDAHEEWRHVSFDFDLNIRQKRLLNTGAWMQISIYSKTSTALLVPWATGIAALAVCVQKQLQTW